MTMSVRKAFVAVLLAAVAAVSLIGALDREANAVERRGFLDSGPAFGFLDSGSNK